MSKFRANSLYKLNIIFFGCGLLMTGSEVWKQWYLTFVLNGGRYQWWFFPFQLCSVPMYILLILPWIRNFRARNAFLTFLMCYGLLGGLAVFSDTSGLKYPVLSLTLHSYLWHIVLIIVGTLAGAVCIRENRDHILSPRLFIDGTLLYFLCCLIASFINRLFGALGTINMFYINPYYKMQQIGFASLVQYCGNDLAIFIYILATVFGASILFSIWSLISHFSCSS